MSDDREVVRDQQQPEIEVARELNQEVRELGLRRGVKGGERLVEDDHGRLRGEGAGHGDPLALAARELVREPIDRARRKPDQLAQLAHALGASGGRHDPQRDERVRELGADLPTRVERRVGVLEDELEPREVALAAAAAEGRDVLPVEDDRSRDRLHEPDRRAGERGLSTARLAHEPDDLPGLDADARTGDRSDTAAATALVVDDDVAELEQAHRPQTGRRGRRANDLLRDERWHLDATASHE